MAKDGRRRGVPPVWRWAVRSNTPGGPLGYKQVPPPLVLSESCSVFTTERGTWLGLEEIRHEL